MDDVVNLSGKVAIVTGSSRGLGRGMAKALAHAGADVVITSRTIDSLAEVSEEITALGAKVLALELDVRDEASIRSMPEKVLDRFGRIDVLVNSAGIVGPNTFLWEVDPDHWKQTIDVNLTGTFNTVRTVVPYMREAGWGRIVNIASIAGKEGNPKLSAYSASKAAVIGLTKSVGKELATENVLVNAIAPAVIATPMNENTAPEVLDYMLSKIPMGRIGEVGEVAELVSWLSSDRCSFSTASVYDISGGRATY